MTGIFDGLPLDEPEVREPPRPDTMLDVPNPTTGVLDGLPLDGPDTLRPSVFAAQAEDPVRASRALALSRTTGKPADVLLADLPNVEKKQQFNEAVVDLNAAPALSASLLGNRALAAAALPDIKPLVRLEQVAIERNPVRDALDRIRALPGKLAAGALVEPIMSVGETALSGLATTLDVFNDATGGDIPLPTGEKPETPYTVAADFLRERAQRSRQARDWFRGQLELDSTIERGLYSGAVSVPTSVLSVVLGRGLGATTSAQALISATSGALTPFLERVDEERAAGRPIQEAVVRAFPTFALEAGLEYLPDKLFIGALDTGDFGVKSWLKQLGVESGSEVLTTLGEELDAVVQGRKTLQQVSEETPEAVTQTLIASLFGTSVQLGGAQVLRSYVTKAGRDTARMADSAAGNDAIQALLEASREVRLRDSAPAEFADLVNKMAAQSDDALKQVYIAGSDLRDALTAAGHAPQELGTILPSLAGHEDALETDEIIAIPVGEAAAAAREPALEAAFLQKLRSSADGLSIEESKAAIENAQEYMNDLGTETEEALAREAARVEDRRAVRDAVRTALDSTGRYTPIQRDAVSEWVSAFYANTARRLGISAQQLFAQSPYRVRALDMSGPTTVPGLSQRPVILSKEAPTEGAMPPIQVTHFSRVAGLSELSGEQFGTGFRSQEEGRVRGAEDERIKRRVNFYVGTPEQNRGKWTGRLGHTYTTTLGNIYDGQADPLGIRQELRAQGLRGNDLTNAFEAQVVERGFDGYYNPNHPEGPVVVVLNNDVPAQYLGPTEEVERALPTAEGATEGGPAVTEDFTNPGRLRNILTKSNWAILTAANPGAQPMGWRENEARNKQLKADLEALGAQVLEADGHYGTPEPSLVAVGITEEQALELGRKYGQESVLTPRGLLYADGRVVPATGVEVFGGKPPAGDYTTVFPPRGQSVSFRVNLDFEGLASTGQQEVLGLYTPSEQTITLFANADFSTIVHETAHRFFDMLAQISAEPGAPQDIVDDMHALLRHFGVENVEQWSSLPLNEQRQAHEKFAEMTELYLYNGSAPSQQLKSVFARFRDFLMELMPRIRALLFDHGKDFTPEVIAVFDRLYAAQEELDTIKRSDEVTPPLFGSAQEMGVSEEQWQEFQALVAAADEETRAWLMKKSIHDLRWVSNALQNQLREERRDVAAKRQAATVQADSEARKIRALNARRWLRTGELPDGTQSVGGKLYTVELRERFGTNPAALWRYLPSNLISNTQDGTLPLDTVAEMFGYGTGNGEQMLREMLEYGDDRDWVRQRANEILANTYGDTLTPEAMHRSALEAVFNKVRLRMVATELSALSRSARVTARDATGRRVNVLVRAAQMFADKKVSTAKVRDLAVLSRAAVTAARQSGRAAERAGRTTAEAIRAKRNQLLHEAVAERANEARADIDKRLSKLRWYARKPTLKSMDQGYLDRIHDLLSLYDLNNVSRPAAERRAKLLRWVAEQRAQGIEPLISEETIARAGTTPYQDMTVEEFTDLSDAVTNIAHLGRLKKKLLVAKDKREFEKLSNDIAEHIRANAVAHREPTIGATTPAEDAQRTLRGILAAHRTMSSIVRQLDGLRESGGPLWNVLVRPMNERSAFEQDRLARESEKIRGILGSVTKGAKAHNKVFIPAINMSLPLETRLAVALNYGNAQNRQRLLSGQKWTDAQAQAIMGTLTADELRAVNRTWEYLDSFWPEIEALYKRLNGVAPKRVTAEPFTVKSADGQTVEMKGGYYPIVYAPEQGAPIGETAQERAERMMNGAFIRPMTAHGFSKARVSTIENAPLRLDLTPLFSHVKEVVHDLAWHEWMIDANRLLDRRGVVASAIRETMGDEFVTELHKTLMDIAGGPHDPSDGVERIVERLRNGATISALGLNLATTLLQPVGATNAIEHIGAKWFAKGLSLWVGTPKHMQQVAQRIYEASPMMRRRSSTFHVGISEVQASVRGRGTWGEKLVVASFFPIAAAQRAVDIPLWLGAYQKALQQTNGDHAKSVALADQAVLTSQGGALTEMVPSVMRGNAYKRVFTNFMGFMNATYNLNVEALRRTNFKSPVQTAQFIGDMMLLNFIPAVLTGLVLGALRKGEPPEDVEEAAAMFALEVMSYMFGGIIGVRDIISGLEMGDYSGPPGTRAIVSAVRLGSRLGNVITEGELEEEDAAKIAADAAHLAGVFYNLPTDQFVRTLRGLDAVMEEEAPPTALIFGPPPQR